MQSIFGPTNPYQIAVWFLVHLTHKSNLSVLIANMKKTVGEEKGGNSWMEIDHIYLEQRY